MKENKKLFRLSLQFFGGSSEDDDFEGDFFDDDVPEYYGSDNLEDEEDDADEENSGEDSAEDQGDSGDGSDEDDHLPDTDTTTSPQEKTTEEGSDTGTGVGAEGTNNDLINELRALGFVGNDLASLTADMKRRREASSEQEARAERAAVNAEGKRHVRSGVPGKSASGDGTGGVSESRVIAFAERTGRTKDEARRLLAKHARMINN